MNTLYKLLLAGVPLLGLAACGGGDTADRLDVADPVVRFVHASPYAPNVTLYRGTVAQSDATNVAYKFGSNYFDVDTSAADWSVKTAVGAASVGSVLIDPVRGNKYTIVALPTSAIANDVYLITDPYNKSLASDNARVRVLNASFNAGNIDLYVTASTTDITAPNVLPTIGGTVFRTAGPATGSDSVQIEGGTYQVIVTTAATKTVLFKGQLAINKNADVLFLTVPDTGTPAGVKVLAKVEGTAGANELPAAP